MPIVLDEKIPDGRFSARPESGPAPPLPAQQSVLCSPIKLQYAETDHQQLSDAVILFGRRHFTTMEKP